MKKLFKFLFVLLFVFTVSLTVSCKKEDTMEDFTQAYKNMQECKNFSLKQETDATIITGGDEISQSSVTYYKEGNDKQFSSAVVYEDKCMEIYSELVDGTYHTYDNTTTNFGTLVASTSFTYDFYRKAMLYLGLDIKASDFSYDEDNDIYVGNVDKLATQLKDYYLSQNPGSEDKLSASVTKFNIKVKDGKFESFDMEYSITMIQFGVTQTINYHTVNTFSAFGTTTVEAPTNINR